MSRPLSVCCLRRSARMPASTGTAVTARETASIRTRAAGGRRAAQPGVAGAGHPRREQRPGVALALCLMPLEFITADEAVEAVDRLIARGFVERVDSTYVSVNALALDIIEGAVLPAQFRMEWNAAKLVVYPVRAFGPWLAYWSDESDLHTPSVPGPAQHHVRLPRVCSRALSRLREGRVRRGRSGVGRSARSAPLHTEASRLPELRGGEGMEPWRCGPAPGPVRAGHRPVLSRPDTGTVRWNAYFAHSPSRVSRPTVPAPTLFWTAPARDLVLWTGGGWWRNCRPPPPALGAQPSEHHLNCRLVWTCGSPVRKSSGPGSLIHATGPSYVRVTPDPTSPTHHPACKRPCGRR